MEAVGSHLFSTLNYLTNDARYVGVVGRHSVVIHHHEGLVSSCSEYLIASVLPSASVEWHGASCYNHCCCERRDDIGTELAVEGRVYIWPANSWQWKYQGIFGTRGPSSQSTWVVKFWGMTWVWHHISFFKPRFARGTCIWLDRINKTNTWYHM